MSIENREIEQFVPFGELLRGVANQNLITEADLRQILRERGIFVGNGSKENTVPILANLLLSPREFDRIKECFNTKEDAEKRTSSNIKCNDNIDLITVIPQLNFEDYFNTQLRNYKLLCKPIISPVDNNKNHLKAEFQIERYDRNKCWIEQTNRFKGMVEFKKEKGELKVITTHTAEETKELAKFIMNESIHFFKKKKLINESDKLQKILFREFSNEERFSFFFRLSWNCENYVFTFKEIVDIEFRPDESLQLPTDIDWMAKKQALIIKGSDIHSTYFLKERKYYSNLIAWKIEAKYGYEYLNRSGECVFYFGFPDYNTHQKANPNAEFEMKIISFSVKSRIETSFKNKLKKQLLDIMDNLKSKIYQEFKEDLMKQ